MPTLLPGPPLSLGLSQHTPFTMPTARHFWKRQNWQRFRRLLSTGQVLVSQADVLGIFLHHALGGGSTGL